MGRKGINDGTFLNYLRFNVAETAAATYKEVEVDTNLSAERGVMMEIHSIEVLNESIGNLDEVAQAAQESIQWHIARESQSAIITPDNSDCVIMQGLLIVRAPTIGTDAGPLFFVHNQVEKHDFAKPVPYVKPSIFIGVKGTDASGLVTIRGRIGYTLREIDRQEFLELLIALQ